MNSLEIKSCVSRSLSARTKEWFDFRFPGSVILFLRNPFPAIISFFRQIFSNHFYPSVPGVRSKGPGLSMSVRTRPFWNFADVPLADDDTHSKLLMMPI